MIHPLFPHSDVRNAYESDIGHFNPPEGGAKLLDPKMRTSADFPKWLNAPETKAQLKDKTVMMYCECIIPNISLLFLFGYPNSN